MTGGWRWVELPAADVGRQGAVAEAEAEVRAALGGQGVTIVWVAARPGVWVGVREWTPGTAVPEGFTHVRCLGTVDPCTPGVQD